MEFLFSEDTATTEENQSMQKWHILSVDDDPMIHEITKLVTSDFIFENQKIHFSSCNSAKEAIEFMQKNSDIALILLDVVMETENAGFDVADFVRNEQDNYSTRIIIRSGQPGAFLKEEVVKKFGIDGFAEKTDITKNLLSTILYSSIRTFRDINSVIKENETLLNDNADLRKKLEELEQKTKNS